MENILFSPSEMLSHMRNNTLSDALYLPSSAGARIAILGLPEVGKRSLYNSLWGWRVITAEMPRQAVTQLGLFDLVDLPQNPQQAVEDRRTNNLSIRDSSVVPFG